MFKTFCRVSLCFIILSLSACHAPMDKPQPEWSSPSGEVRPGPGTAKAVLALLRKARQASRDGALAKAESYLDRAIRIEPRNPALWLYMSKLRLYGKNPDEAISLAKKAMALAPGKNTIHTDAWLVIAHAYQGMGKHDAAARAQHKSRSFAE